MVTLRPDLSAAVTFEIACEKLGWRPEPLGRIFFEEYLQQSYDRLWNVSQLIYRQCGVLMLVDQSPKWSP